MPYNHISYNVYIIICYHMYHYISYIMIYTGGGEELPLTSVGIDSGPKC